MQYVNNSLKFLVIFTFTLCMLPQISEARRGQLEWRVESDLKKLEIQPAYAGEKTPFTVQEKPREIKKRVVKIEKPKELTPDQVKALKAADVLNEIRTVLSKEEIFNADLTSLEVDAVMSIEGVKSALIKNRWYEEGGKLDVPVAAKENLLSLVGNLKELDESLAEVVESQVNEKIQLVKNLSLKVEKINNDNVLFVDEQGNEHVINFKPQRF